MPASLRSSIPDEYVNLEAVKSAGIGDALTRLSAALQQGFRLGAHFRDPPLAQQDAQAARQDDVERVADVAFLDQQRALAVLAQFAAARQVAHGGGQFGDVENVA